MKLPIRFYTIDFCGERSLLFGFGIILRPDAIEMMLGTLILGLNWGKE